MKILWLSNIPSPYRVDFFNELGRFCRLTVLFEKAASTERDESWKKYNFINFKGVFLKGLTVAKDKALCIGAVKYLGKGNYDYIIVSNIATPTGILAIEYMKLLRIPYIIEGDGGFAKNGKGIKELFKKHLIRGATAYFSTSRSHDNYYLTYGAKKPNIYRYPFTSLFKKNLLKNILSASKKQEIKKTLRISEEKIILGVGRFIPQKGYDILLKICKYINSGTGVYIIGGKPTKEYSELIIKNGLSNVHFIDFKNKEELFNYYKIADLFVLPTRGDAWGLVVNEAMANGLPVITTDRCVAGLELVEDNENGFLVPVDDEKKLCEKINLILSDDKLRQKMAKTSLDKIKNYTIENMAKVHMDILNKPKKTKILFLGSVSSADMVKTLSGGSVAGNKMQLNIIENLKSYDDLEIKVLSILSVAAFPKDRKIYIRKRYQNILNNVSAEYIPFLNIPFIKQVWQMISLYCNAKKIIKKDRSYIVLSFNLFPQTGLPLLLLKKRYGCKTVSLLADLPIDDNYNRKGIGNILHKIFNSLTKKTILNCDNLIVLNRNAATEYNPNARHIVVDGGVNLSEYDLTLQNKEGYRNIVYSGRLTEYNGISEMIEAMNYLEQRDIELHIYGAGPLKPIIETKAASMDNVKYYGCVSNQEMMKIQREAWLLINPRPIDDKIAKVTFPSKIFEYMLSKTPILTTKLNAFTKEYYDKMFFVDSNNSIVLANKINEIANLDEKTLSEIAQRAQSFVINNKSWKAQSERIYQFIKEVDNE